MSSTELARKFRERVKAIFENNNPRVAARRVNPRRSSYDAIYLLGA